MLRYSVRQAIEGNLSSFFLRLGLPRRFFRARRVAETGFGRVVVFRPFSLLSREGTDLKGTERIRARNIGKGSRILELARSRRL